MRRQTFTTASAIPRKGDEFAARVVIGGYGRVGHTVGTILASSGIPASPSTPTPYWSPSGAARVIRCSMVTSETRNCSPLRAMQGVDLVVLTIDDQHTAVRAAAMIRSHAPQVTIVARARDLASCDALLRAGVNKAFPELLEASLRLAAEALEALGIFH
jgi:glutathione-regulated potassium-efflux system ancillary protein KefC